MRYIFQIILLMFAAGSGLHAQLTIEICQEKALTNYPMIKQFDLIKQSESYNLSNANKGYLPQLTLSAKATYQSDVIEIPIKLPLFTFDEITKDQYQIAGELSQMIWDGGAIGSQKEIIEASSTVESNKLEVDLYSLKDRINQLFFGVLLIDEYLKRNGALQTELRTNQDKISALRDNGVAIDSDVDVIKVEIINAKQKRTELAANKKAFLGMLSKLIGEVIPENIELFKPLATGNMELEDGNNRPEIKLFESQSNLFATQTKLIDAGTMPKIGLFFLGGYGKPGFNLLENDFSVFWIGGIRFSWNLGSFYTKGNNYELIELNRNSLDIQKETFLFNNNLKTGQQKIELEKLNNLISNDDEIIKLRGNIKKSAEAKVDNGTLSVSDLIREINAENLAILDKAVHEMQLLTAIYNFKYLVNQ